MIIQNILNADITQVISSSVHLGVYHEIPVLVIKHKSCCAAISLQGSQLLFWQPSDTSSPIIWLSEKTPFTKGTPIRGGVPICWPHFANFGDPLHGFARLLEWTLLDFNETDTTVTLTLQLTNSSASDTYTDKFFCLTTHITLGTTCHVKLVMEADELEVTTALHTYFNISDINQIKVSGLGPTYHDKLDTINTPTHIGEMIFNQAVDRIYTQPNAISLIHDTHRTIQITHHQATDVVLWNPGADKCKTMTDMATEGYKNMVCIETGRVMQPIACKKNQKTELGFNIEII